MILSVCIPTYNRLPELKVNLRFLIQEVISNYNGDVEIIISDNCSTDGTFEYVNTLANQYSFIISHTNTNNIGMVPNWKKSISLARGKFVWLLGSDDIVIPGKFSLLKDAIYKYPDINLILLNNKAWSPKEDDYRNFNETTFEVSETHIKNSADEYALKVSQLLGKREDQFTPIYLSIMKKEDWVNALNLYDLEAPIFSTLNNCVPQATYVANQLFDKDGYYISTPLVLASSNVGWKNYFSLYCCYYLVCLHGVWFESGADPIKVNKSLENLINAKIPIKLFKDLFIGNRENLKYFSYKKYFSLTYKFPKAYKIAIYIAYLNSIYAMKSIKRYFKQKGY